MSLQPDDVVGPYRVLRRIGEGGMGQIFLARDSALDRDVAIKVLPEAVAKDPDRLLRFKREAQVLAALNHPNIAQVFGLQDVDDTPAIVMELVEGPTLADRLASGPLPVDEALDVARQIALGLEAAHARHIVHRDLKPSNVKVRPDGTAKILDFGLAKITQPPAPPDAETATITSPALTALGVILGTAAYMAPEQARGREVDERVDVWALGCLLYEMLTGRRAFRGNDPSEVIAAILASNPDWSALPRLPPGLRVHLERCLAKDPAERVHDVADVRLAIDGAFEPAATTAVAPAAGSRPGPLVGAFVVGLALAGVGAWFHTLTRPPTPVTRFTYDLPEGQGFSSGLRPVIAVSPDGRWFAFSAADGLYVQSLDQLSPERLTDDFVESPFFSPDGREVGYYDGPPGAGTLYRVPIDGGARVPIVNTARPTGSISWLADGTLLFALADRIVSVSAAGGSLAPVIDVEDARDPQILPTGDVLFVTSSEVVIQSLSAPDDRTVLPLDAEAVRYVPDGLLMYKQGETLYAAPFDAASRALSGQARAVTQGARWRTDGDAAQYGVSENGTLVYIAGNLDVRATLIWVDRDGVEEELPRPPTPSSYYYARISPDGTRVALDERNARNDVRVYEFATGTMTTLPTNDSGGYYPAWQDNQRIGYHDLGEPGGVSVVAANGTGARTLLESGGHSPYFFTDDGRLVSRGSGIWLADLAGATAPRRLLAGTNVTLSPDGRWMAYQSEEDDLGVQVYVRPFPNVEDAKYRISPNGGIHPVWSPGGRELFYVEAPRAMAPGTLMSLAYDGTGSRFVFNQSPARLMDWPYQPPTVIRQFDISPTEDRFLVLRPAPVAVADRPRIVVALNWLDDWMRTHR